MIESLICCNCNSLRIKTPSGAVCPNGHGKIIPGVTESQLRIAEYYVWTNSLPLFILEEGKSRIYLMGGERYKTSFFRKTPGGYSSYRVPIYGVAREGTVIGRNKNLEVKTFTLVEPRTT